MKRSSLVATAVLMSISLSGCEKAGDLAEAYQQIQKLEQEKKELQQKLSKANDSIEQLRKENSNLKSDLVTLADKDKKNLECLFGDSKNCKTR